MRTIPFTQGQVALVDDGDFENLNKFKWCAHKKPGFIAVRNCRCPFEKPPRRQYMIYMSHQIMSCPRDKEVDHKDHNTLNNQRFNLRICTHVQNQGNRSKNKNNTSGYKGVYKDCKKWAVRIAFNKRRIYLGPFDSKIEAARAYDRTAKKCFGEFAYLNFPKEICNATLQKMPGDTGVHPKTTGQSAAYVLRGRGAI